MLTHINRSAVVITPTQSFFNMIAKLSEEKPDKAVPPLTEDASTLYLIREFNLFLYIKRSIKIFVMILFVATIACFIPTSGTFAKYTEAPNFPVFDVNGDRHVLYAIIDSLPRNAFVVLNFTSVDCRPCRKEIHELVSINVSAKGRMKLMCIYSETGNPVKKLAQELGALEFAYVDPLGAVRSKFDVKKIPVTVIVNKKYEMVGRFEGYNEKNMAGIKGILGL